MIDIIGYAFSILFGGCYIPQIWKLWDIKDSTGLSVTTYWICMLAYLLAIYYTIVKFGFDIALLLNYGSGLILCAITICLYYKFKK